MLPPRKDGFCVSRLSSLQEYVTPLTESNRRAPIRVLPILPNRFFIHMMLLVAYVFSYCCYLELAMRRAISSTTQRKFKAKTSYLQAHTELFSHRRFSFLITKQSPLTFLPIFATYTRKWQFFLAISANSKHQTPFFAPPTLHFHLILKMASCP